MALCQLINQGYQSPDVCYRTIRDFLAAANGIDDFTASGPNPGPGYEIVDESYNSGDPADTTANDWCVLKSNGEAGTYPHYLLFTFGTTYHKITLYRGWDAEAHRGLGAVVGSYNNIYHNGAGVGVLYIHADLDEVHIVIKPQNISTYHWHPFGRIKPDHLFYDGTTVQVAGAITAGASMTIPLPSWPGWAEVGRKIYSWDADGIHELTITAASEAARTITVEQAWAKTAGSWLAEDVLWFVPYSHSVDAAYGYIYGAPRRVGADLSVYDEYRGAIIDFIPGVEEKYGNRILADILVFRGAGTIDERPQVRGRLALARGSQTTLTPAGIQGVAMTDEQGQNWRLYVVFNGRILALREAY